MPRAITSASRQSRWPGVYTWSRSRSGGAEAARRARRVFTGRGCGRKIQLRLSLGSSPGALTVKVRIRLGSAIARLARAPVIVLELPDDATIEDVYDVLATGDPRLGPALRCALPVLQGSHVERAQALAHGDEVALLTPVSGG
jgi:molybdopterin converting factor small subunit